jgi:hypothetical protein
MTPEDKLRLIAERLKSGDTPTSVSVRELLSWFGARRRGYYVVQRIREALSGLSLETTALVSPKNNNALCILIPFDRDVED